MKTVKITPKKAAEWLQRNVNNRPLRAARVKRYKEAMVANAWQLNGETIKFNCNGDLVDGQHRLHACMQSGVSFESYVVEGVGVKAFDTIDQGDKRSISDVFARHNYKYYCILSAAARLIWQYENKFQVWGSMREDIANDVLERHPGLHAAAEKASKTCNRTGIMNQSMFAFLDYWTGQNNQEKADQFWTSIIEADGLERGSPAHVLHKRLQQNSISPAKLRTETVLALAVKGWNAYFSKKPCGLLKMLPEEEFPTILY